MLLLDVTPGGKRYSISGSGTVELFPHHAKSRPGIGFQPRSEPTGGPHEGKTAGQGSAQRHGTGC